MKTPSLIRSTGIIALSTIFSRIMGYARDMIIAHMFGASGSLDAFFVAFRIPNLLRRLVGEGALTISFIPVYTEYLVNKGEDEAQVLAQKTISILVLVLSAIVALGVIFSPQIVQVFAYGFTDPGKIDLTVDLTRIMFFYLFFIGLVAFCMGILNSHRIFFAPAFSPVLLNVGFIAGAVILSSLFREPLVGLAVGVIVGGFLQLASQLPSLKKIRFVFRFSPDFKDPGIRRIFRLIAPAVFGIAIYQINILVSTMLASLLPAGSISYLYYADRLLEIVLGIFIVSIGNAIMPELSRMSAASDHKKMADLYVSSARAALFMAVPAMIALMTIGYPVISVLFVRGEFTAHHAAMTDRALFYASIGLSAVAILRITTPTFYSLGDARLPVISAAVSLLVNAGCGYMLMRTSLMHAGLSLANSIAAFVQVALLLVFLKGKIPELQYKNILTALAKFVLSGGVMGAGIALASAQVDWVGGPFLLRLICLIGMVIGGIAIYGGMTLVLRVDEVLYLYRKIMRRIGRGNTI